MAPFRPLVIVGMHRSGTSLVARLLERCGLFVGWRNYPRTCENPFFVDLNAWILRQGGVQWDHPDPVPEMWRNEPIRKLMTEYVDYTLRSPLRARFLGPLRWIGCRDLRRLGIPWGFKDPRVTLTLPFWREALPEARWLYVTRHGVDVAQSLRTRWHRDTLPVADRYRRYKLLYLLRPKRISLFMARCATLESAFAIWEAYMSAARANLEPIPERDKLEIRYEDLLADPEEGLSRLAEFSGLPLSRNRIESVIKVESVRADRAFAYRKQSELRAFAIDREAALTAWGYAASTSPHVSSSSSVNSLD
jgi:hypothetical protein